MSQPGLITAWQDQRRSGADLDISKPAPKADFGSNTLEGTHGKDDSVVVGNTEEQPWRPMVLLRMYMGGRKFIGSGLLIAPNVVLTAGHNLFQLSSKKFFDSIVADVGLKNGKTGAQARAARVEVCPGYEKFSPTDPLRSRIDYGIIRCDTDALGKWVGKHVDVASQAPMPDAEYPPAIFSIAGYPFNDTPLALKTCAGKAIREKVEPQQFWYTMDSMPGQSGGPVFRWSPTRGFILGGIHVAGDTDDNRACRYSTAMQKQLQAWLGNAAGGTRIGA